MFRLLEMRPIKIDLERSGTTTGNPGEGIRSGLCWTSYQAGSIHTSATQSNVSGERVLPSPVVAATEAWAGCAASRRVASGASEATSGRGIVPVVKS